ncbi:hypothetical protein [Stenotrophomonas sp.]|uniref:hypothetical protein n=1 Tax=Stenotrophomonas sp. TaxID=69392 RepID=UPI00289F6BBB|nr:hypothetical protein [Stenotrophomonas sp.]
MDKPTDSEIIDRLGGTTEVARICQIKPPSVSEWRATGIPPARRQYLALLRPDAFGIDGGSERIVISPLVDSRMSKRALRARLGLSSDAHLAKVLQLPAAEVEAWPDEQGVPALPQVLKLLGVVQAPVVAPAVPEDPDAGRIIDVEAA